MKHLIFTLEGIVLGKRFFSEKKNIYTLYTKELGKIQAFLRGTQNITNKMSGHLESFGTKQFTILKGRNYYQIIGCVEKENFFNISLSYNRSIALQLIFTFANDLFENEQPDENIYYHIVSFFYILNLHPKIQLSSVYFFLLKLVALLGYQPQIAACTICNRAFTSNEQAFLTSISHGGIICKACSLRNQTKVYTHFDNKMYTLLNQLFKNPIEEINLFEHDKKTIVHTKKFIVQWIQYYCYVKVDLQNYFEY